MCNCTLTTLLIIYIVYPTVPLSPDEPVLFSVAVDTFPKSLIYLHLLCTVLFEDVGVYFEFLLIFSSHITEDIVT